MPSPRMVSTSPGWVPAARSTTALPSSVGTLELGAEGGYRGGHVKGRDQIVTFAHEALVLADAHEHVQVARRRAGVTRRCPGRRP